MNSTLRSSARSSVLFSLSVIGLALLAGCGGGGGGVFGILSTVFGYDPFSGSFNAGGEVGQPPIIPQNMCVLVRFNESIDPRSVSTETITVQEIDLSTDPPSPGPDAGLSFDVSGSVLVICPLIVFSDTNVSYGFQPNKTYQLLFEVPPATNTLRSRSGSQIKSSDRGPFFFQTNDIIFDRVPGAPEPTISLRHPTSNAQLNPAAIPTSPVPRVQIDFNEPVIPSSVIDDPDNDTSGSIHVELDLDGDVSTDADRVVLPGSYLLSQDDHSAQVIWTSPLSELPTDNSGGCVYVVTVDGTILDLSGHNKVTEENDPAANDTLEFHTVPGDPEGPADPVVEAFSIDTNEDKTATSARWGKGVPGFLSSGIGGGTGTDGVFDPEAPEFQINPPDDVTIDVGNRIVTMSTESGANPGTRRLYEFTSFKVPLGWVVEATGSFPLEVLTSGTVVVEGLLDISGSAGEVYNQDAQENTAHRPGAGGVASLGGAAGGRGGSATFQSGGNAVDTFFPGKLGAGATYLQLGFVVPGLKNAGTSGRSTAILDFSLTDDFVTFDLTTIPVADLWLQPNVAADDFRFERFHPAFKVASISGSMINVVSDSGDANFHGTMTQETANPTLEDDGSGGFRTPLLAEICDAYLLGDLRGVDGSNLFDLDADGDLDDVGFVNGGRGSEPQSVMQTFVTLGRAGGGGGGGSTAPGGDGVDDPTVDSGAGPFGGTGWIGAEGGDPAPTTTVSAILSSVQIRLASDVFDDGSGAEDDRFVGHRINPRTQQGLTFVIGSVDATDTCTVSPVVTLDGDILDLSSIPNLVPGSPVRIAPPFNAGGAGGGGAGLHCAGSFKDPAEHEGHPELSENDGIDDSVNGPTNRFYDDDDLGTGTQNCKEDYSEPIFILPQWIAGGGGGGGGGSVRLVVAGDVTVGPTGVIRAEGGEGGRSNSEGANAASGGGGGAGGSIFIGTGGVVSVITGGEISAVGGLGGAIGQSNAGGDGAAGRVRIENILGNLDPEDFEGLVIPEVTAEHLGIFPGGGQTLGQSKFIAAGVLVPSYQRIMIAYRMTLNGSDTSGTYTVEDDGQVDSGSTLVIPPFGLFLNFTTGDPDNGLPLPPADPTFIDPTDPSGTLDQHDGDQYFRFKIILPDASQPLVLGSDIISAVRIDSVTLEIRGSKP